MIVIIAAVVVIGVACLAGVSVLAYLLHRDRGKFYRPGDPLPDMPPDAPIRQLAARIEPKKGGCRADTAHATSPLMASCSGQFGADDRR